MQDFFVSIFELKTSVWIIVSIIVASHVDLLPTIIANFRQKRNLQSSVAGIVKSRTEEVIRFAWLMGLTVSSVFVVWVVLHTAFIHLDSTPRITKWCAYLNVVTLTVLTFCSTRWGTSFTQRVALQKLFLIANTIITWVALCGILMHVFDTYIFSTHSRQAQSASYFTMAECGTLTLFYVSNLLLIFTRIHNERFFAVARNISVVVLMTFIGSNFYMLSTFPFRDNGMVKTLFKNDPQAIEELRKLESMEIEGDH